MTIFQRKLLQAILRLAYVIYYSTNIVSGTASLLSREKAENHLRLLSEIAED